MKVAAVHRRRWRQCGSSNGDVVMVFLSRGKIPWRWKNSIVPQIVVPRIMPKPRRKIVLFEEVSALFEVLFGGTLIVEISTEKRSPTTFQYSCAATEKCIIILYTFCVYIFYPDNFGSHVPSCFSYHVFSHVILFNCCYEVSLVVPLPPLGLIYILQTRPLFELAFLFNTSFFPIFSHYFLSPMF